MLFQGHTTHWHSLVMLEAIAASVILEVIAASVTLAVLQGRQKSMRQYKSKPEKAQVCIIGSGASGATAAKMLTEAGIKVVVLERGPWMKKEDFGADELANVNRY